MTVTRPGGGCFGELVSIGEGRMEELGVPSRRFESLGSRQLTDAADMDIGWVRRGQENSSRNSGSLVLSLHPFLLVTCPHPPQSGRLDSSTTFHFPTEVQSRPSTPTPVLRGIRYRRPGITRSL
jgi:hypothetical protein